MLLMMVACNGSNSSGKTESQTNETASDTAQTERRMLLSSFVIIRPDDASDDLIKAVKSLNATVKEIMGNALKLYSDFSAKQEAEYEIVVGVCEREACAALKTLGTDEYLIRTVQRDNGVSIVVGGSTDASSALAVYEFEDYIKNLAENGDMNMELPMLSQSGSTLDFALSNELLSSMVIIQPVNTDSKVGTVARFLKTGISSTVGKEIPILSLSPDDDISQYPNAIVVGAVGSEAKEIQSGLSDNSYTMRVENNAAGTRVYLVGEDDLATMRAVQYYYSKSVVNGKMRLAKYFDLTVTPVVQRDPCIVPFNGKYYMYTSHNNGYGVRVSEDLLNWSAVKTVFDGTAVEGFTGDTNFWAPECHYYNGKFYLFATYHSTDNDHRGVSIFSCDKPDGTFRLISKRNADAMEPGHITPEDWDAIDGTLYVDSNGKPWMVFVYELTSTPDGVGRMAYAPLSDDLTYFTAEPEIMFKATDPSWASRKITDGPWMYTCEDGTLLMLWSNMGASGYAVGIAVSSNGRLDGEWVQCEKALVTGNRTSIYSSTEGGHGMVFKAYDGRMYLAIHTPNTSDAALTLIPLIESDGMLYLDTVK